MRTDNITKDKDPIINCHAHVFTGDHVPPFLTRSFVPWPFYFLFRVNYFVTLFRWWYKGPGRIQYGGTFKSLVKWQTRIRAFINRITFFNIVLGYYIIFFAFFILFRLAEPILPKQRFWIIDIIDRLYKFSEPIFPKIETLWLQLFIVLLVAIFFRSFRSLVLSVAKILWAILRKLPGKQTKEMLKRYYNIARYAFHEKQGTIISKLKSQYPPKSRFVILTMDMDYMEAGKSTERYREQINKLAVIRKTASNKDVLYPFIFVDPRRIGNVENEKRYIPGDKVFFDWSIGDEGQVVLKDCVMKDFIETHRFKGIKIYPALGYYPFDEKLLPLWKYAADNQIPVMTHCIKGVIFYRGIKKQEWNEHPVFQQAMSRNPVEYSDGFMDDEEMEQETISNYIPLVLPQFKNIEYSINFTHPMNYLCILEEELLRKVIDSIKDKEWKHRVAELFGYTDCNTKLKCDLHHLKICFGHFGGEEEWKRYFEKERYNYSSQLLKHPEKGIDFFRTTKGNLSPGKPEQLWKYTDWYSIICSLILKYPNVYADISYILHSEGDILPLLKQTLQNPGLREFVLYGTDFFVVRNHKSDKNIMATITGGLSEEDFDQIARINPANYLR